MSGLRIKDFQRLMLPGIVVPIEKAKGRRQKAEGNSAIALRRKIPWHWFYRMGSLALGVGYLTLASLGLSSTSAVAQITIAQSANSTRVMPEVKVLFVNPSTGNDTTGNGTEQAPFKTITQALRIAQPNTIIRLAPGIYTRETGETFPLVMKPGVTIQGNPRTRGENIIIRGGGTLSGATTSNQNITILGANEASLTGVTVTNPNTQGYGLWIESSSPVVVDNTFTDNTNSGIAVKGNSAATIRSNYFYNNGGDGIILDGISRLEVGENVFQENNLAQNVAANAVPPIVNDQLPERNRTQAEAEVTSAAPVPTPEPAETLQQIMSLRSRENSSATLNQPTAIPAAVPTPSENIPTPAISDRTDQITSPQVAITNPPTPTTVPEPSTSSISAASFPVPSLLSSQTSASSAASNTIETPTPTPTQTPQQIPLVNPPSTVGTSTPTAPPQETAATPTNTQQLNASPTPQPSGNATASSTQATPGLTQQPLPPQDLTSTGGINILVPQPEPTASAPTATPPRPSENSNTNASSDSISGIPVLTPNPQPSQESVNRQTLAITSPPAEGQRYRVLVEARNPSQQELVRSLVPGAFRTVFNGRTFMQAGVFSTRENADEMQQFLSGAGLNATIEPIN